MEKVTVLGIGTNYYPNYRDKDKLGYWFSDILIVVEIDGKRFNINLLALPDKLNEARYDLEGMANWYADRACEKLQQKLHDKELDTNELHSIVKEKGPMLLQKAKDLEQYFEKIKKD